MYIRATTRLICPQSNRVSDCIPAAPECGAKAAAALAGGPSLPTLSRRSGAPLPDDVLRRFNVLCKAACSPEADGPISPVTSLSPATDRRCQSAFHSINPACVRRRARRRRQQAPHLLSLFAARLAFRAPGQVVYRIHRRFFEIELVK